jgi:Uma2 family endonuclease
MTVATSNDLVTTEQLMAMPEDGKERWLIDGELREKEMTKRNRGHSRIEFRIGHLLSEWNEAQPEPRGEVLGGEAGVRIAKNPDTTVGVDVAYVPPEVCAASPEDYPYLDGAPLLIVEVLSPSDRIEEIEDKVAAYLRYGVKRVWVVHPTFRTITVHRPDAEPQLYNVNQSIDSSDVMPGFKIALRDVFGR